MRAKNSKLVSWCPYLAGRKDVVFRLELNCFDFLLYLVYGGFITCPYGNFLHLLKSSPRHCQIEVVGWDISQWLDQVSRPWHATNPDYILFVFVSFRMASSHLTGKDILLYSKMCVWTVYPLCIYIKKNINHPLFSVLTFSLSCMSW